MTQSGVSRDPLATLREYRQLAPWSLRDMVALATAILEAAGITPLNAAATAHPNERTVRFYVTRGLVTPPDGRGTAAIYGYRHLLQVLGVKLRQMEGATLDQIETELQQITGDVLERRVAATLGSALPMPQSLPLTNLTRPATGRAARMLQSGPAGTSAPESAITSSTGVAGTWHRISVSDGIELHVSESHPLVRGRSRRSDIAGAVRAALKRVLEDQRSDL